MTVPAQYLGVWKRSLLRTPRVEDTTSEVYWMQTKRYHGDIRIPADRPTALSRVGLGHLSRPQLMALAAQQGFAGITVVEDDICRWHRKYDYQPPTGFNDIGRMSFVSEHQCLEYGIEQDYFEIWDRLPDSVGETFALDITPEDAAVPTWLLRTGAYVMRVTPRAQPLEHAADLATAVSALDDDTLRAVLSFEVSFGKLITERRVRISHSTLPYLEQTEFDLPMPTTAFFTPLQ